MLEVTGVGSSWVRPLLLLPVEVLGAFGVPWFLVVSVLRFSLGGSVRTVGWFSVLEVVGSVVFPCSVCSVRRV